MIYSAVVDSTRLPAQMWNRCSSMSWYRGAPKPAQYIPHVVDPPFRNYYEKSRSDWTEHNILLSKNAVGLSDLFRACFLGGVHFGDGIGLFV